MFQRKILSNIPEEIFAEELPKYLDVRSVANLSACSQSLFAKTCEKQFWHRNLILAGVSEIEMKKISSISFSINYNKIFNIINKLHGENIKQIYAWELLCYSGDKKALQYACEHLGVNSLSRNLSGKTILHLVCLFGNLEVIKYALHDIHCNPYDRDVLQRNSLSFAVLSGSIKTVKYLLRHIKFNKNQRDQHKQNLFHLAIFSGSLEMTKWVAEKLKVSTVETNIFGQNALHIAAHQGNVSLMKYCYYNLNIFPIIECISGANLLHNAVESGSPEAVLFAKQITREDPSTVGVVWENAYDYAALQPNSEKLLNALAAPVESSVTAPYDLKL